MTTNPKTPKVLHRTDLGIASLTSPTFRRNPRRDTLNPEAIQAIHLNNELAGDDGLKYAAPEDATQTGVPAVVSTMAKTLFKDGVIPSTPPLSG